MSTQFDRLYNSLLEDVSKDTYVQVLKSLTNQKPFIVNTPDIEHEYIHEYDTEGLKGYVETTYDKLVEVFGEPVEGVDKTTAEWYIKFLDGTMANIYDYKTDYTPKHLFPWHVGGKDQEVVNTIASLVGGEPIIFGQ